MRETLSGGEKPRPSTEELRRVQEEHLAAKEAEEQARAQAGEEADERLDLIADVEELQKEVEERKARGELEAEISFSDLEAAHKEAQGRLAELREIIEGVPAERIAEEVSAEIIQATKEVEELQGKLHQAEAMGKLEKINQRIAEIEANPAMIELLTAEAKTEDKIREEILRVTLEQARTHYPVSHPERRKFIEQVVQMFLTEEFQARDLKEIKDLQAYAREIIQGLRYRDIDMPRREDFLPREQRLMLTGQLLRNLTGGLGTIGGTFERLLYTEAGFPAEDRDQKTAGEAIRKHLKTLNFIRSYAAGLKSHHLQVAIIPGFGSNQSWQKEFDLRILGTGYRTWEGQPILPDQASEPEKVRINEAFERHRGEAQAIEAEHQRKGEEEKEATIQKLESQIQELRPLLPQLEQAEAILKDKKWQEIEQLEQKIASAQREIASLERKINRQEEELSQAGPLSFRHRGRLNADLEHLRTKLAGQKRGRDYDQERLAKLQAAEALISQHRSKYQVESEIRKLEYQLEQVRRGY